MMIEMSGDTTRPTLTNDDIKDKCSGELGTQFLTHCLL